MEDKRKERRNNGVNKIHFAKFHERIQNKYAQMQRRLEKSRSMESILSLGEDILYENQSSSVIIEKNDDEVYEIENSDKKATKYRVIVEDINKQDAVSHEFEKVIVYETEDSPSIQENEAHREFFGNNFSLSLDNLSETSERINEDLTPTTPSQRFTLRDRIAAVRERRREKKEKKKERKDKLDVEPPEKFILSNKPGIDSLKKKYKVASVSVALIEATVPENEVAQDEKTRQLYCRIRLGQEKYKSKSVKINENVALWQELFNFSLFEDNFLEITVWEKDILFGRTTLDVSDLEQDKTYKMNLNFEEAEVPTQVLILITVSGAAVNTVDAYNNEKIQSELSNMNNRLNSYLLLSDEFEEVGWLSLVVYKAKGLAASDCFASFEIGNDRVQTHVEHKTNNPCWMKMYRLAVKDSTSVLYVTIHDEKKPDIVGKLSIPLLAIKNGERKWYALKDTSLRERAKGQNPCICLEMYFFFNLIKSSLRVVNPKEKILLETAPEFRRHVFTKNIVRTRAIVNWITASVKVIKQLFEWDSRTLNTVALTAWLVFWWYFQAWMMPLLILTPFFWYRPKEYQITRWQPQVVWEPPPRSEDDISVSSNMSISSSKDSRTTIRQKIQSLQETVTTVQNGIGTAASLGESVKNLFNFTVPYLSFLAIFIIVMISVIMFFVPCRIILMGWGVHKYLRKTLRPKRIPNNEILDLISRVPDDEQLLDYQELPLLDDDIPNTSKIRKAKDEGPKPYDEGPKQA